MQSLFICLLTGIAMMASPCCVAADLVVIVKNVKSEKGQIVVTLYDQAGNWLKSEYRKMNVAPKIGESTLTFKQLPRGEYAVATFQDQDGDGRMATNLMGIPTDPIGFSNDAKGKMGPPLFTDAKISVNEESLTTAIILH